MCSRKFNKMKEAEEYDFSTSNMKKLYSNFNDNILIDSTYHINKYKLPLIVLSVINEEGRTL